MGKLDVIVTLDLLLTVSASELYSRNSRSGILLRMCSLQSRNQIWCSSKTQIQCFFSCIAYVGVLVIYIEGGPRPLLCGSPTLINGTYARPETLYDFLVPQFTKRYEMS